VRVWVRRLLWEKVPRDHRESADDLRRRQLVTAAVVLIGAVVLGVSLRIAPGSVWFYPATLLLAAVWTVGAFASGPLHLGYIESSAGLRRPVATPVLLALVLVALFVVGALVVRQVPVLDAQVRDVLAHADRGVVPLVVLVTAVNGVAEELFFRGAAYAAVPRHPVLVTWVAYAVATLAAGNVMLGVAALVLGLVVGLERRASGGVLGPILTHVTWSVAMLLVLPVLF